MSHLTEDYEIVLERKENSLNIIKRRISKINLYCTNIRPSRSSLGYQKIKKIVFGVTRKFSCNIRKGGFERLLYPASILGNEDHLSA